MTDNIVDIYTVICYCTGALEPRTTVWGGRARARRDASSALSESRDRAEQIPSAADQSPLLATTTIPCPTTFLCGRGWLASRSTRASHCLACLLVPPAPHAPSGASSYASARSTALLIHLPAALRALKATTSTSPHRPTSTHTLLCALLVHGCGGDVVAMATTRPAA